MNLLAGLVVSVLLAAPSPVPSPITSAAPTPCTKAPTTSADWLEASWCVVAFCSQESDCWAACPSAQSVECINDVCTYHYPSSGGGGGGGNGCGQSFCWWDGDCSCNGSFGLCDQGVCRF